MNCPRCDENLRFCYEGDNHAAVDYWYCKTCGHDVVEDDFFQSDGEYDDLPMPSLGDMVLIEDEKEKPKRKNEGIKNEFGKLIVFAFLSIPGLVGMALIANQIPDTSEITPTAVMNFFVDVLPAIQVLTTASIVFGLGIWIVTKFFLLLINFLSE